MDKKKAFDSSSQWISDEQRIHETADYGRNKQAVNDALSEQQRRVKLVNEYAKELEKAKASAKSTSAKQQVTDEYTELKEVAEHRQGCLQDIAQIASLEDIFNTLSIEFAQRATSLVVDACSEVEEVSSASDSTSKPGSDGIARAAQSCILAVRNNWNWISKLVKCSDVHLKHVSDYHQFFHEAKEYQQWMPAELNKHIANVESLDPEENGGQRMLMTLKETLAVFLHWQNKINTLFEKSRKIVPVHFRTKPLDHYRPITSLCDYKTNEISIQEGEELTLIDNSKPQIWMVRNMHAKESQVPSVICIIPGPDPGAVTAATRLRLQLLKTWTVCVKNIGRVVILFFTMVFRDLDENSSKKLKSMRDDDKMRIIQVLQWITDILGKYWTEDPQYRDLLTRINNTRTVVKTNGNPKDYDSAFSKEYITRVITVEELLTHFRNYLKQWETYKLLSETSRHSDFMLLVENWEELRYFSTEDVLRKANLGLEMVESYGSGGSGSTVVTTVRTDITDGQQENETTDYSEETTSTTIVEETIQKVESTAETSQASSETIQEETVTTLETVHQTAETEQYLHAEQEERKKFIITGVIDPRSGEEISFDKAVELGIIDQTNGTYVNLATREAMPIPAAMNSGKIKVEMTTVRKTEEKKSDVGLLTITMQRESRPYTVKAVVDVATEEHLTIDEAIERGILDQKSGMMRNTLTRTDMSLADAMDSGNLIVEYDKDEPAGDTEMVSITYAIHAVVDQRGKTKISFSDAVRRGLIDKETGAYFHNVNLENIYVGDAIKRGFIKATVVKDPSAMDIAPENRMVVEKVDLIRKKLINPLKAIHAMSDAVGEKEKSNGQQSPQAEAASNEPGLSLHLENGSHDIDISNLSPRQPGDGTEAFDDPHYDVTRSGQTDHNDPPKNTEAYLDQRLVTRMSSSGKESRLTEITRGFLQKKLRSGSETVTTTSSQSGTEIDETDVRPKSSSKILTLTTTKSESRTDSKDVRPKTTSKIPTMTTSHKKAPNTPPSPSRIPRFKSSEYLHTKQGQHTSNSRIGFLQTKSQSLDELGSGYGYKQGNGNWNDEDLELSHSNTDVSVSDNQFDSGVGQSISGNTGSLKYVSKKLSKSDSKVNRNVLIYTEETESIMGVNIPARIPEVTKVETCTVGTQYEGFDADFENMKEKGEAYGGSGMLLLAGSGAMGSQSESSHSEQKTFTKVTVDRTKIIHTTHNTDSTGVRNVDHVDSDQGYDTSLSSDQQNGLFVKETLITKEGEENNGEGNTDLSVTQSKTKKQSLRYRGSKSEKTLLAGLKTESVKQESDSEEEAFYLATAAAEGGAAAASFSATGIHSSGVKLSKAAENIQMVRETTSTHTDELQLLQEAIAVITADPDIDDKSSEGKRALCLRICKACLPLQMLMLLLLGLACLLPMSEEEYSCALANNFANSFSMMLKHKDGPPPM